MNQSDKSLLEKTLAEGWFDDKYTAEEIRAIAKEKGLSFDMIEYWYGVEYGKIEGLSNG